MVLSGSPSAAPRWKKERTRSGISSDRSRKRRQPDRHDVEAEEQVLAKRALLDREAQVLVGRRHDADIGLDRRASADGRIFALLKHAQKPRLRLHRHVADLVQKERSSFGLLEAAGGPVGRAGEGALLVAEKLALDQVARDRRHVDRDERPALALAVVMQGARDQLLARAGLARDHHGQVRLHQSREHAKDVLHRGRTADDRHDLARGVFVALVAPLLRLGERAPDDGDEFAQVEGLWQIFVSPALGRLDRGHERVLRAHHDDRQVRPHPLDAGQKVESIVVGHHDVGDDEIALSGGDPAPEAGHRSGRADFIARARQRLVENRSYPGVVVGDQDVP